MDESQVVTEANIVFVIVLVKIVVKNVATTTLCQKRLGVETTCNLEQVN